MVATYRAPWPLRLLRLVAPLRASYAIHADRMERDPSYAERHEVAAIAGRAYRNARSGPGSTPFANAFPRSVDAEMLGDLPRLRSRCRELARDDAVGSGIVARFRDQIVGQGIEDRGATGNDTWNAAIDAVWTELRDSLFPAERVSWVAAQRLLATRRVEDGEVWVVRSLDEAGGLFFECVEADRVASPLDAQRELLDPEGDLRDGVERDRHGRIVRYWVSKWHPGDVSIPTLVLGSRPRLQPLHVEDFVRVDVANARHLRLVTRPGQSRAVPVLHAVAQDLRDLDYLAVAVLKRFGVCASFAVCIKTDGGSWDALTATTRKEYGHVLDHDLQPGALMVLYPGESIETVNPNLSLPDVAELFKTIARRIGSSLGISWQVVLADYSDSSFAGGRLDRTEASASMAVPRQDLIEVLAWIRRGVLEDAAMRGDPRLDGIPAEALAKATWYPPAQDSVAPEKDAIANEILHRNGALTLRDWCAELALDWRDVVKQRVVEEAYAAELRKAAGLPPAVAPAPTPMPQPEPEEPKRARRAA